jgi:hypothetical protein
MPAEEQHESLARVLARLEALEREHAQLLCAVEQLVEQRQAPAAEATAQTAGEPPVQATTTQMSRRGMIKAALGGAAATAGAAALLESTARPVAAARMGRVDQARASITSPPPTARPLLISQVNQEAASTEVRYAGAGTGLNGILLLANDGTSAGSTTTYRAALGGWAAGGAAKVTTGVYGLSSVTGGNGVVGSDTATDGTGVGVRAVSATGSGLVATTGSTASGASAVQGTVTSTSPGGYSAGVYGQNNGTGGSGIGVYGAQNGFGWGVYGTTPSGSGVYGYSTSGYGLQGGSNSGTGAYVSSTGGVGLDGHSSTNNAVQGTSGSGIGVQGSSSSNTGVQGSSSSGYGVYGSSPNNYAVVGVTNSGNALYGQVSTVNQSGVVGRQEDASGNWALFGFGNIGATGTKVALVPAENGSYRTLYSMASPECWFEDFGAATLTGGSAQVSLDPLFANTVLTAEYHVFLVPEGDCKGLFVSARGATGFTVRELQGGTSSLPFSYRVVARRKDVPAPRLRQVSSPGAPTVPTAPPVRAQNARPPMRQ